MSQSDGVKVWKDWADSLSKEGQWWLHGYLSALLGESGSGSSPIQETVSLSPCLVLFGSQSGNSEGLAREWGDRLEKAGYPVEIVDMADAGEKHWEKATYLFGIVSTWGDGDPPDTAEDFFEKLEASTGEILSGKSFSVLALGDSSYEHFCATGIALDKHWERLGAKRMLARVDCDVEFDGPASQWMDQLSVLLGEENAADQKTTVGAGPTVENWSRSHPFHGRLAEAQLLNGRGSAKETWHYRIDLKGSGLQWKAGDALGILPVNDPGLCASLLAHLPVKAEDIFPGQEYSWEEALHHHLELNRLTPTVVKTLAEKDPKSPLNQSLQKWGDSGLKEYLQGRDWLDLVSDYPVEMTPDSIAACFRKLSPRLYSIASSWAKDADLIDILVATVRYQTHGRDRKGVCSTFLADRLQVDDSLPLYIHKNPNFFLPADPETPIIMVGPGTGVAPFRAFIQERSFQDNRGPSWLFFGDQHFQTDFLYQLEWQEALQKGLLTKLDLAFSRDFPEKVYVQHRMREAGKELFQWLAEGAFFYVCGDAQRMAPDVHQCLLEIGQTHGGFSPEEAQEWLKNLTREKRYQRDVY